MTHDSLTDTATAMVADGKGLLAMDESTGTCNARLAEAGIAQTVDKRRAYRDLLATTPDLASCISGAILYDETFHQCADDGTPFPKVLGDAGILPGIKVDLGAKPLAGHPHETVTEGLDGLRERLVAYHDLGARFAKWRAVIRIGAGLPTEACLDANAHALARYAALCQEAGVVPIVEPEVLMDGDHPIEASRAVTTGILHRVFEQLERQDVVLEAMILKPNMVLPGLSCGIQDSIDEVAEATVDCLLRTVPAAVAGIAFLSGGQSERLATAHLNAMHLRIRSLGSRAPWPLSFSFGRALQNSALATWAGEDGNRIAAQQALLFRARCNSAALHGRYDASEDSIEGG